MGRDQEYVRWTVPGRDKWESGRRRIQARRHPKDSLGLPEQMSEARLAAGKRRRKRNWSGTASSPSETPSSPLVRRLRKLNGRASGMVALFHTAESKGPEAVAHAQTSYPEDSTDDAKTATDEAKGAIVEDADEIADRLATMTADEVTELRKALFRIKPVAVDNVSWYHGQARWGQG